MLSLRGCHNIDGSLVKDRDERLWHIRVIILPCNPEHLDEVLEVDPNYM